MCSRIDVPGECKLGLGFDLWLFDLRVSACRGPAMDYYVYRLWCYSSSRFPFTARTDRQTYATERPAHARRQQYRRRG